MVDKTLLDCLWVVFCAILVFMMQAGFLCLEAGLTRSKNAINVAIKNITDFGISSLLYWAFGFAWMFGQTYRGWIGTSYFFITPDNPWVASFLLFQIMFCGTAVTIISGAVAERMRYRAYILVAVIVAALIYPVFGHWVWGGNLIGARGWLSQLGFIDFAGSSVVHSVGGWASLAVLLVLGPRLGYFPSKDAPRTFPGSHLPLAILGVLLLWFGWIGFNGGSTFELGPAFPGIIVNTVLAGSGGMLTALAVGWIWQGYPKVLFLMNGSLAGLVAITAGCFAVDPLFAIVIGSVGGVVMAAAQHLMDRFRIDDVVGAVPVHAAAGIWGTLAVALFGKPELLATGLSRWEQFQVQCLGVGVCFIFAFGVTFVLTYLINRIFPMRVTLADELQGLNITEHRETTEIFDLLSVMERQARTKDLSLRVPAEPYTEVGQIAHRYNKLMDSLQESLTSITNLRQTQASLKEKTAKLEELNQELRDFAHTVAHDLKSPLRTIKSFGTFLNEDYRDSLSPEAQEYLDEILKTAGRMNTLIDDILQYSRVATEGDQFVEVNLFQEIQGVIADLQGIIQSANGKVEVTELPVIEANPVQMRQLFQNLIGNALKYHQPLVSPCVKVSSRPLPDTRQVQIVVEDNGIGFEEKYATKIFEPFKRLHKSSQYEGTGIGLATCLKIIQRHKGTIHVSSAPGKGSVFTITVPLQQTVRPPREKT
ncbi:MAG: hypothetical protein A2Z81_06510 [Omnitrophica WOR_2 bacterium GWA2_45_18]|nr:MAG: hypothetical protein A2Z81_06510 [Omnitrophica WOR_2 bacterium GWA2_45_18]